MPARILDYSALVRYRVGVKLAANLEDAAALYEDRLRTLIGIQGPPRSTPGNPPHMDTTDLNRSVDHVVDPAALVASIGSEMPYAAALEMTTNRPAWIPCLVDNANDIADEICKP